MRLSVSASLRFPGSRAVHSRHAVRLQLLMLTNSSDGPGVVISPFQHGYGGRLGNLGNVRDHTQQRIDSKSTKQQSLHPGEKWLIALCAHPLLAMMMQHAFGNNGAPMHGQHPRTVGGDPLGAPSTRSGSPLRSTARATRPEPSSSRAGGRPWSHAARCNIRHPSSRSWVRERGVYSTCNPRSSDNSRPRTSAMSPSGPPLPSGSTDSVAYTAFL